MSCGSCATMVEGGYPHQKWCVHTKLAEAQEIIADMMEIMDSKVLWEEMPEPFRRAEAFLKRLADPNRL